MSEPVFTYDEASDTLYVSFAPGEKATGIELNEQLLLRINKRTRSAVGVTIFNYSFLAQKTEMGLRTLPLTGLDDLSEELRELVIDIIRKPPVCDILSLAVYTPTVNERIPITSLRSAALAVA